MGFPRGAMIRSRADHDCQPRSGRSLSVVLPWELQSLGGRPSLSPSEEDRETLRRARLLRGTHGQEEAWKGFVEVEGDNLRPKPHSRCQVSPGQLDQADAAWNEGMRFSGGYPLNCTLDSVFLKMCINKNQNGSFFLRFVKRY